MTPSTSRPISVAHTGTPRTKLAVPSIGSITQRRGTAAPHPRPPSPRQGLRPPAVPVQELTNDHLGAPVRFGYRGLVCLDLNGERGAAEGRERNGVGQVGGQQCKLRSVPISVELIGRRRCRSSADSRALIVGRCHLGGSDWAVGTQGRAALSARRATSAMGKPRVRGGASTVLVLGLYPVGAGLDPDGAPRTSTSTISRSAQHG